MIIGLVAIMGLILGGGSLDYYYLHDFDKSINYYVDDKERSKELKALIKDYEIAVKEYQNKLGDQIKLFKEKNKDKSIPSDWYYGFFDGVMELRKDRQANAINFRLTTLPKITDDEWQVIKIMAKETDKKSESSDLQSTKKEPNYIADEEKHKVVMQSFDELLSSSLKLRATYDDFNAAQNKILVDKSASEEDMKTKVDSTNNVRVEMYKDFIGFLEKLKENTTDEEWEEIMKDFNKEVSKLKY